MKEATSVLSFFVTTKTVWVSENFKNIFLDKYEATNRIEAKPLSSSDLQELRSDVKPQKFVLQNPDTFLEQLSLLIQNQLNGEEGKLLNDSSANYFLAKGKDGGIYSVLVRWESSQKLWRCGAYLQEELKLPTIRIFYPQ